LLYLLFLSHYVLIRSPYRHQVGATRPTSRTPSSQPYPLPWRACPKQRNDIVPHPPERCRVHIHQMMSDVQRHVVVPFDLVEDLGEAEVDEHFELPRRGVELSVVGKEFFEGYESCESVRSEGFSMVVLCLS
jgi:hypothetical protein